MFHMKKKVVVAVIGAMAGLGGTGAAHADAYAFASNQITNFTIASTAAFSFIGTATRDTITTAQFTGFPIDGHTNPVNLGTLSDALQSKSGPGPFPAENTFTQTAGIVGTRGDAITAAGSPFAGGVPLENNVAEGRALSGSGRSGASAGRNTADAAIRITSAGTFTFSFTDLIRLRADADLAGETANASIATSFSIVNSAGAVVYSFAPDGVLDPGETADPFSLQRVCGSNSGVPVGGCIIGPASGFFSGTSQTLGVGDYSITLRTASQENVLTQRNQVPEPTSLLLVGAGILGLGIVRRRKSVWSL